MAEREVNENFDHGIAFAWLFDLGKSHIKTQAYSLTQETTNRA